MLCDSCWIAQLQSISFEEIDSLQRIEKKNDCSFKPIGANFACDEKTTFKTKKSSRTQQRFLFY
jgi:hypothetical protein